MMCIALRIIEDQERLRWIEDNPCKICIALWIIGWHEDDPKKVPTKDLPWAQAMIPLNDSKNFSAPRVGDWIVGFFMDGEQAQLPVMMGVLPGLKP